ncbi:CRE-SRU-6 protein [Caenorhabditis remanei]|uniref:CRE-SRU-6 protein n=1 Tax=Caenorhabditis remanei TaxID=31234 RepID=E3NK32_CAERE|nr:CRE-SRU-6 protein [Caenorhabditis remanei]
MSSNSTLWPNTIHFNETYMNYRIQWNGWPQICAVLPWIYILPSFHVICKIFSVYLSANWTRPEPGLNQHVFLVISLSQLTVFIFFLFDWFMVRLPSTGLFTSWCASIEPNHFLKFIFMMAYYTNYCAMIFPFLMPVVRLVVVSFPRNHFKINSILLRVSVPVIWLYPLCFTFFLIPAVGVCRQISSPYPLGAIHIYYANAAFGLRNSYFYLYNTIAWLTLAILANILLFLKVAKARAQLISFQKSAVSYKAELSITITTVVMILFYVINGGFIIIYVLYYGTSSYFSFLVIVKAFANDAETCVVPWIFYLTHPVFKKKAISSDLVFSTSSFKRRINNS